MNFVSFLSSTVCFECWNIFLLSYFSFGSSRSLSRLVYTAGHCDMSRLDMNTIGSLKNLTAAAQHKESSPSQPKKEGVLWQEGNQRAAGVRLYAVGNQ